MPCQNDEYLCVFTVTNPGPYWRFGVTAKDRDWLSENVGSRCRNEVRWNAGRGAWWYKGSRPLAGGIRHEVQVMFRRKSDALMFKLARANATN